MKENAMKTMKHPHTANEVPVCCLTEAGLECIGEGHAGCGWHGCEEASERKSCRYIFTRGAGITGYELDENGEDEVWLCPSCGGECAHTPMDEQVFEGEEGCQCPPKPEGGHVE